MARKGEKIKSRLTRDVCFKDQETLIRFIMLYQDLILYYGDYPQKPHIDYYKLTTINMTNIDIFKDSEPIYNADIDSKEQYLGGIFVELLLSEPIYKYRIIFRIWNDDWKNVKKNLNLKSRQVYFTDYRVVRRFVFG